MPAAFLLKSTAHLRAATIATFGESILREGGIFAWFPSTSGGTDYTTAIPGSVMNARQKGVQVAGLSTMQTDEIALLCDATDLPFTPIPEQTLFLVATAIVTAGEYAPDPADSKTYLVKGLHYSVPGSSTLRITAELHA